MRLVMNTRNSSIAAACLAAAILGFSAACVVSDGQTGQTDGGKWSADTGLPGGADKAPIYPQVDFSADYQPSWITSTFIQEVRDETAAAELAQLGFEFSGKHFIEQVIAGNMPAVKLFLNAGMPPDMRSLGGHHRPDGGRGQRA